jgi:peroxin-16
MSTLLAQYEAFLVDNVSTISSVESTLRTLTWFLPGRFKDAELASEAGPALSLLSRHRIYSLFLPQCRPL